MIDLALVIIYSIALYKMAQGYNIMPWKWIIWYLAVYLCSLFGLTMVLISIFGEGLVKDVPHLQKIGLYAEPFILLYEFVLFYFIRTRIIRYVHELDRVDNNNNNNDSPNIPSPPKKDSKDQKDFSYFR